MLYLADCLFLILLSLQGGLIIRVGGGVMSPKGTERECLHSDFIFCNLSHPFFRMSDVGS